MAMKHLKQTNRTILFSEINSDGVPSLIKILEKIEDENSVAISDELFQEIEDNLVVDSFEKYLEKFKPTIYSRSNANGEIEYSLKKDGAGQWTESPINMSNDFIRLILNIIDGKSGITNIEFDYQDEFKKLLGVESSTRKIEEAIGTLQYLIEEYEKTEEGSPERKNAQKSIKRTFQKYVKNYSNPITMLPWYQSMITEAITEKEKGINDDFAYQVQSEITGRMETKLIVDQNGIPDLTYNEEKNDDFDEDMNRDFENGEITDYGNNTNQEYEEMLDEVYEKGVEKGLVSNSDAGKQMLTTAFARKDSIKGMRNKLRTMSSEDLTERYNKLAKQIDTQYANFAQVAKQLIEEIVGVREFFEQSKIKKNQMSPELLVTNCELAGFIDKEEKLRQFLEKVNRTESNYDPAIWYAIIPNMQLSDKQEDEEDWFDEEEEDIGNRGTNSVSSVTKMVRLLGEYNIQSFIGFENNAENTFSDIQQRGIQKYKDATKQFIENDEINKFLIPCLPNFTVVPENKSRMESQGEYQYIPAEAINDEDTFERSDKGYIELGGFYVNAAYIAAGIVCACQSPDYLREKKLKVVPDKSIPGVRFDIENHFDKIDVKMGIEVGGYSERVKNEINDEQFGFVFASEGGVKTHIMKARSLKKTEADEFEPIFVTSTYTYIERLYRSNNINNITKDTMDDFFGESKQSTFWKKYLGFDNALLQKDDVLHHEVDSKNAKLDLKLKGVERQLNFSINH